MAQSKTTRVCILYGQKDLRIETQPVRPPAAGEVLVKVSNGGICGSDLHYYLDGGFGKVRVTQPIILGHEFAGVVAAVGDGVTRVKPGQQVAVNPTNPCGDCIYCRKGLFHHCLNMRFWGSAMRLPHEQGGFRDWVTVKAERCFPVEGKASLAEAAMCEPVSVALHAAHQAGDLGGKRVLIAGSGPIGALVMLVARDRGAREVVITDILDEPLSMAKKLGADRALNVTREGEAIVELSRDKGYFDVAFECSGNAKGLATCLETVAPTGTIVQVGQAGMFEVPIALVVAKELKIVGTFRFYYEYAEAAEAIAQRRIDVRPLITKVVPMEDAVEAFELAADKSKAMKVQLAFG